MGFVRQLLGDQGCWLDIVLSFWTFAAAFPQADFDHIYRYSANCQLQLWFTNMVQNSLGPGLQIQELDAERFKRRIDEILLRFAEIHRPRVAW